MGKLTKAQIKVLSSIPGQWELVPSLGDTRSIAPLLRLGMAEERRTDVTPTDWGAVPVRLMRVEWRLTPAGRQALQEAENG